MFSAGTATFAEDGEKIVENTQISAMPQPGDRLVSVTAFETQMGDIIPAGTEIEVVGVLEVSKDVAQSGHLLTFKTNNAIHLVDLAAFPVSGDDPNYRLSRYKARDRGPNAEVCASLFDRNNTKIPDLTLGSLGDYLAVKVGGADHHSFAIRFVEPEYDNEYEKNEFCVTGLPYSTDVEVVLKRGFQPGAAGPALTVDLRANLKSPAKTPRISIDAGSYILPLGQDSFLPIRTVNVPRLSVEVIRIDPRSITNTSGIFASQDDYGRNRLASRYGQSLGKFDLELSSALNTEAKYNLRLNQIIGQHEPGLFVVVFDSEALNLSSWENRPTQWFIKSDIGIVSFSGLSETQLILTDFQSLEPVAGAKVQILANNNRELFVAGSDLEGIVRIPQSYLNGADGNAPAYVIATTPKGDFALLDFKNFKSPPGPLSGGIEKTESQDAYLTLAREIVRPGRNGGLFCRAKGSRVESVARFRPGYRCFQSRFRRSHSEAVGVNKQAWRCGRKH